MPSLTLKDTHFPIECYMHSSWLLITICFSPAESAWGVYPSETDNFTVSFYCEKRAEARGEELGMEPRSTWSDVF